MKMADFCLKFNSRHRISRNVIIKFFIFNFIFFTTGTTILEPRPLEHILQERGEFEPKEWRVYTYLGCPTNPYYGYDIHEPLKLQNKRKRKFMSFEPQILYNERLEEAKEKVLSEKNFKQMNKEDKLKKISEAQEKVKMTEMIYDYKWIQRGFETHIQHPLKNEDESGFPLAFQGFLLELKRFVQNAERKNHEFYELEEAEGKNSNSVAEAFSMENLLDRLRECSRNILYPHLKVENQKNILSNLEVKLLLSSLEYLMKFQIVPSERLMKIIRNELFFFDSLSIYLTKIMALSGKSLGERVMVKPWAEELMNSPLTRNLRNLFRAFNDQDWKRLSHKMIIKSFMDARETSPPNWYQRLMQRIFGKSPLTAAFEKFSAPWFAEDLDFNPEKTAKFVEELIELLRKPPPKIWLLKMEDKTYHLMLTHQMLSYIFAYSHPETLRIIDQDLKDYFEAERKLINRMVEIKESISSHNHKIQIAWRLIYFWQRALNGKSGLAKFEKWMNSGNFLSRKNGKWLTDLISNKFGFKSQKVSLKIINPEYLGEKTSIRGDFKELEKLIKLNYSRKLPFLKKRFKKPYGLDDIKKRLALSLSLHDDLYRETLEVIEYILGSSYFRNEWLRSVARLPEDHPYWKDDSSKYESFDEFRENFIGG